MAESEKSRLSIDASGGLTALNTLVESFRKYNKELVNVKVTAAAFDKTNAIISATLLAQDKAGNQLISTIKRFDSVLSVTKTTALSFTDILNKNTEAAKRLAVESAKAAIPKAITRVPSAATSSEREKFNKAQQDLLNLAAKSPDTLAAGTIQNLFNKILAGSQRTYTGVAEEARRAIVKVIAAHEQLGASAKKQEDAIKALARADAGIGKLQDFFGGVKVGATEGEIEKVRRALIRFRDEMRGAGLNLNDLKSAISSFKGGELGKTPELEKLRQTIADVDAAYRGTGKSAAAAAKIAEDAAKKLAEQEQKRIQSKAARTELKLNFDPTGISASSTELEAFNRSIGRVAASIAVGRASFADFQTVVKAFNAGNLDQLPPRLNILRNSIVDISNKYRLLGEDAKKSNQELGNIKLGEGIQKQLTSFFGAVHTDATTNEIRRIEFAVASIVRGFEQGKSKVTDFAKAFDAIKGTTSFDTLTNAQKKLFLEIDKVGAGYKNAGSDAAKSADDAVKATIRQQAEIDRLIKKFGAEAAARAAAARSASNIADAQTAAGRGFTAFGPISSKVDSGQLETFKSRLASAVSLVEKGKVSLGDFDSVVKRVMSGAATSSAPLTGNLGILERRLQSTKNAYDQFGQKATQAAQVVASSWTTTANVFKTLVIADILSRTVQQFENIVSKAADFQISIGLILTLADKSSRNFDQWSNAIRSVSDELGKPITDVATAAYDALSNQVINTADDFNKFGREVGQLAIITKSDLKSSVDAVSGVMNSFNLTINDTARINSVLFKSIDLGKIKMSELADTVGRVGPIAQSLGIQFEELNAFLTSTSRAGITVDIAMTQVGQVLNALLKPNEELTAFFKTLGATSGEDAIAIYGFTGVLQKLKEATGGSTAALSKMFPELRGLRGIVSVLRNDFKEFTGDLDKLRNDSRKSTQEAAEIFNVNPGQKFREELEKIKNFFLETWENVVLKGVLAISDAFGGLSNVLKNAYALLFNLILPIATFAAIVKAAFLLQSVLAWIKGVYAAIAAMNILTASATASGIAMSTAFGPIGIIVAGLVAAFVALKVNAAIANVQLAETARVLKEVALATATKNTQQFQQRLDAQVAAVKDSVTKQSQAYAELPAKIRANLNKVIEVQKEKNKEILDSLKQSTELFLGSLRSQITQLGQFQTDVAKQIQDSKQSIFETNKDVAQGAFERNREDIDKSGASQLQKKIALLDLDKQQLAILKEQREEIAKRVGTDKQEENDREKIRDLAKEELDILQRLAGARDDTSETRAQQRATIGFQRQAFNDEKYRLQQAKQPVQGPNADAIRQRNRELDAQIHAVNNQARLLPQAIPGFNIAAARSYRDVEEEILKFVKARAAEELKLNDIQEAQAKRANEAKQAEEERLKKLESIFKKINEFSITNSKGELLPKYEHNLNQPIKDFQELRKELDGALGASKNLSEFQVKLNLQSNLKEEEEKVKANVEKFAQSLKAQTIQLQADLDLGKAIENINNLGKAINKNITDTRNDVINAKKNYEEMTQAAKAGFLTINAAIGKVDEKFGLEEKLKHITKEQIPELMSSFDRFKEEIATFSGVSALDTIVDPKNISSALANVKNAISKLDTAIDPTNMKGSVEALKEFSKLINDISRSDPQGVLKTKIDDKGTILENALREAKTRAEPGIGSDDIKTRIASIKALRKELDDLRASVKFQDIPEDQNALTLGRAIDQIKVQLGAAFQAAEAQKRGQAILDEQAKATPTLEGRYEGLKTKINETKTATESFSVDSKTYIQDIGRALDILRSDYNALREELMRNKISLPEIQGPPDISGQHAGGFIRGYASGGFLNDFYSGRFARGADTIPIMAKRGESIINSHSTAKFYSQIVAMNQGRQPLWNKNVTNVGDVNVNISSGVNTPAKTARQIGFELKRELRRGNLR